MMCRTMGVFLTLRGCICLIVMLMMIMRNGANAFPSLLVESKSGCMYELNTEEVIMNAAVIPHSESKRPDLYVGVIDEKDATIITKGPVVITNTPATFQVRLVNPGEALPDVQYAVETTEGAVFTGGGCGGKRTVGRLRDDAGLELIVHDISEDIKVWAAWAGGHEAVTLTEPLVFTSSPQEEKTNKTDDAESKSEKIIDDEETKHANEKQNESEQVHKDALDEEIQVLRENVKVFEEQHHESGTNELENKDETVDGPDGDIAPKETEKQEQQGRMNKENVAESILQDRDESARKGDDTKTDGVDATTKKDEDKPNRETIERFKEKYIKLHADTIKDATAQFRKEQLVHIPKSIERLEEMFQSPRRQGLKPKTWQQRYHHADKLDMQYYTYGAVFFIVAMLATIQICTCLAKGGSTKAGHIL